MVLQNPLLPAKLRNPIREEPACSRCVPIIVHGVELYLLPCYIGQIRSTTVQPGHCVPLGFQLADVIGRHLRALPPAGIHDLDQRKIRLGKVQRLTDSGAVASIAALETRMLRASADPVVQGLRIGIKDDGLVGLRVSLLLSGSLCSLSSLKYRMVWRET